MTNTLKTDKGNCGDNKSIRNSKKKNIDCPELYVTDLTIRNREWRILNRFNFTIHFITIILIIFNVHVKCVQLFSYFHCFKIARIVQNTKVFTRVK